MSSGGPCVPRPYSPCPLHFVWFTFSRARQLFCYRHVAVVKNIYYGVEVNLSVPVFEPTSIVTGSIPTEYTWYESATCKSKDVRHVMLDDHFRLRVISTNTDHLQPIIIKYPPYCPCLLDNNLSETHVLIFI
jgi:hypothetical protein